MILRGIRTYGQNVNKHRPIVTVVEEHMGNHYGGIPICVTLFVNLVCAKLVDLNF